MDESEIILRIKALPVGTKIDPSYRITGIRMSHGEPALFYSIPKKAGGNATQKSIPLSELEKAYRALLGTEEITRTWFVENMRLAARQSTSCSFKVMGEVFSLFGVARSASAQRGHKYVLVR